MIRIITTFNVRVTYRFSQLFPFSGLVSIHLWLTDKPCSFFNNKIAPAGKSVVTIVPFLPISVNPYLPPLGGREPM